MVRSRPGYRPIKASTVTKAPTVATAKAPVTVAAKPAPKAEATIAKPAKKS